MSEATNTEPKRDHYDEAVAGLVKDFTLCAGCEDEIVVSEPGKRAYCAGCQCVDDALRWDYEKRDVKPLFRKLPRTDVGISVLLDDTEDLPEECLAGAGLGPLVAVVVAAGVSAVIVFCLAGWYGLRALAAFGIWLTR